MLNNDRSNLSNSINSSSSSSFIPSNNNSPRLTGSEGSSSRHTNHTSSLLPTRTFSPTTTDRTSLPIDPLSPPIPNEHQLSPPSNHHHKRHQTTISQCSEQSSILFGTSQTDESPDNNHTMPSPQHTDSQLQPSSSRTRLPSFNYTPDDESIEELLKTLGYSPGQSRANSLSSPNGPPDPNRNTQQRDNESRGSMVMLDIDGREFSIHEHSLSPVSERTELETESSKTSSNKRRPLVQSVLSQRFQSGLQSTAPLALSPKPKHLSTPSSPSSPRSSSPSSLRAAVPKKIDHPSHFSQPVHQNRPASFGSHSPNSLSPVLTKSSHLLSSPPVPGNSLAHPSLHRLPKKTSHLIQLFENSKNQSPSSIPMSTPPNKTTPTNRIQSAPNSNLSSRFPSENHARGKSPQVPVSPTQTREASNFYLTDHSAGRLNSPQSKAPQSPAAGSTESLSSAALPGPSMTEQECLRLRRERRERIAMASKNHAAASATRLKNESQTAHLAPPSPMSDHFLKHRKSVASSITTRISDVQVLHSGSIWYRNPQTNQWRQTRGILTTEAVYLMNENGEVDQNLPDQSIELNLSGCTSVESVRSKRSYGPDFNEPHLHILRIAWAEFDPRSNSRTEFEEFLGCSRATQRADWVGAIWQAAHDLGGFVDQPDIPLRGNPSPKSDQLNNPAASSPSAANTHQPNTASPALPSKQDCSPRLDPVSLVDRSVSVGPAEAPQLAHSPTSQLKPPPSSAVSSRTSEVSTGTSNLQSELDRDLVAVQQATNPQILSPACRLYSEGNDPIVQENFNGVHVVDPAYQDYPINPNQEENYTRSRSPELDIFAMLDRMSVKGSIHRNTAEFYDPPKPESLQPQQVQDMHNPQPISNSLHANITALEDTANQSHRSPSRHSYHTIRPTSATGVHEQLPDSARSSAVGSRSSHREQLSEVRSMSQATHASQNRHLSVTPTPITQRPAGSRPQTTSKPRSSEGLHEPTTARQARGAWSDTDRLSNQTDNILLGANPARAVQRDLRRILKTIERNDSYRAAESDSLGHYLDSIQNQLQNVAIKLRGHQVEREPNYPVNESDEPTIADKVDYMLSLCNILLESQHKVSSAVEKNLEAHGVSISNRSVHTRSMRSTANPSRRSSHVPTEPGMPGPAPLTPRPDSSLDNDRVTSPDRLDSPPLPPLPDANGGEENIVIDEGPGNPSELPPQVAIQEAGLSRIENLLVELLSRVDESTQRQNKEPAPPVPDKDVGDGHSTRSRRSHANTDSQSETLDLDADVALWKSRGNMSDPAGPWNDEKRHPLGQSVSSHAPSVYPPTEAETPSSSDQPTPQVIPDYNLAYEAEDQVARRIADERARAARRLEGVSTPFGYRQSIGQGYSASVKPRVPSHLSQPGPTIPPNQDQHAEDPYLPSSQNDPRLSRPDLEQSHWSSTTPTAEEQDDSTPPPPPPPKDDHFVAPPPSQPALSVRAPSRVPSRAISHQSAARPLSVASNPPAPIPPPPQLSTEELRNVVHEALQHHSTEQAPVLEEVVTLLRTQDQVNQASVLNQAEVSRYLTQLNTHLEGVLHKKNDEILQIGENVGRLEKQLAVLLEQSQQISSVIPLMNATASTSAPPPEQAPTSIDQPEEALNRDLDAGPSAEPQTDVDPGPDGPIDVSVHPQEGDALDPPLEGGEPHVTLMSKKPSVGYRITGPRARKISFNNKGLKGPRMPSGLATVGKLWGGPVPAADRAARWGTGAGGSLKRVPTKSSHVSENPATVEAALSAVNPDDPVGQEALSQMDHPDDDRAGTIALGVSHILKFLRENSEKEELRRQKKEQEKAAQPQPAIPDEMEQRRAKIEELQLRREATLAEDKAKQMEAMMQAMRQQAIEHDRLLKKISEELEAKKSKTSEPENEEEERKKRYEEAMSDVNNVLTNVESGVMAHLEDFKAQMMKEMKQTFEKVGELREQKQQIQADIADMLSYMSKVRGGGPDPRWQHPIPVPSVHGGPEGSVISGHAGPAGPAGTNYPFLSPIPESYPSPHADFPDRDGTEVGVARSNIGFGPRSPSRR
ncbi:hypothetical protein PGT21_027530 [Puccinia graminis f. sp. tritici]|uniref:PH domain-containing protein n=1 Tax=Puccinia graminis f. sp. tritici TaxID=56615 RepID=A0A5B0RS44_PUCGR|nr:hypothetical protein PGT21_027530 [Puccinia graminis f. sp. tritici]KAA1128387.1 hypothetical protein PGTUg99_020124 [Puccinia graminis f. sp. tritici]